MTLKLTVAVIVLCCMAAAQQAVDPQIDYAIVAESWLRHDLKDPDSLRVLRIVALHTAPDKHGRVGYGGCINYTATNTYGGRTQEWVRYGVEFKQGSAFSVRLGGPYTGGPWTACATDKKHTAQDITAAVVQAQAAGRGAGVP